MGFASDNGSASGDFQMLENTSLGLCLQAAPVRNEAGGEGDICTHRTTEEMWEEEERQAPTGGFPRGRRHLNNNDRVRQPSRKE